MPNKTKKAINVSPVDEPREFDKLYVEFLKHIYDDGDHVRAKKLGARLQDALSASAELAASIRGDEIRSLLAELHGDYTDAIHSREAEIRKILELHTLAVNTPSWAYVASQYDCSDVSDRLDLLAVLYDRLGDTERAISTLLESRQYCQSHHIDFDGQDMLDELELVRQGPRKNGAPRKRDQKPATVKGRV
jgi:hypothetical protein